MSETTIYKVVVNQEGQLSIWPVGREDAIGWKDAGFQGTEAECLNYIEQAWTDMRPLSLRGQTDVASGQSLGGRY